MGLDLDIGFIKPEAVVSMGIKSETVLVSGGYRFDRGIYPIDPFIHNEELLYFRKHHALLSWFKKHWEFGDIELVCIGTPKYILNKIRVDLGKIRRNVPGMSDHLDIADDDWYEYYHTTKKQLILDLTRIRSGLSRLPSDALVTIFYVT